MARTHPLAFVCPDLSNIARYAVVENAVYRVLRRFLPGPYTFILEATREVPKLVQMKRKNVGIRVPACEVTRTLARELGRPIISSTAARPGEDPFVDPHEIDEAFHGLALVLDGGAGGLVPTTVIDLTTTPPGNRPRRRRLRRRIQVAAAITPSSTNPRPPRRSWPARDSQEGGKPGRFLGPAPLELSANRARSRANALRSRSEQSESSRLPASLFKLGRPGRIEDYRFSIGT